MTPDERTARDTIFRCWQSRHYWAFEDDAKHACADCIAVALAAEREACAKVAEATTPPEESTAWTGNSGWASAQFDIADAIRARGAA